MTRSDLAELDLRVEAARLVDGIEQDLRDAAPLPRRRPAGWLKVAGLLPAGCVAWVLTAWARRQR